MQTIYIDNTNQYVYTQLIGVDGKVFEGQSDGEALENAMLSLLFYKRIPSLINPAVVTWSNTARLWIVLIPNESIKQFGSLIVTVMSTLIADNIIDVKVGISDNQQLTVNQFNTFASDLQNVVNLIGSDVSSIVNSEVLNALDTYNVPTMVDISASFVQLLNEILTLEIRSGRTLQEFLKIADIIFTGEVTNSGSGLVTMTGTDGSTITIVGDNIGNRTDVVVNIL